MKKKSGNRTPESTRLETVLTCSLRQLTMMIIFVSLVLYPVGVLPLSWPTTSSSCLPIGGFVSSCSRRCRDATSSRKRGSSPAFQPGAHRLRSNVSVNGARMKPSSCTLFDTNAQPATTSSPPTFYIRKALYSDLNRVAHILVQSFYGSSSTLVRPYLYLSELSRLQSNFPYDQSVPHRFYVAVHKDTAEVIGFVDVDARPTKPAPSTPPRPYLSDLAVSLDHRRRGIARSLIIQCERTVSSWGKVELHLRVEGKNDAALDMYDGLGYVALEHAWFGVRDTTILLRKEGLSFPEKTADGKGNDAMVAAGNETSAIVDEKDMVKSAFFLDYMV